ncbi:hypothetical protein [Nostoc sp.]
MPIVQQTLIITCEIIEFVRRLITKLLLTCINYAILPASLDEWLS